MDTERGSLKATRHRFLPAGGTISVTVQHSTRASMTAAGRVRHETPPDFHSEQTGSMLRIEASCVG
jgi:hypothetical protein